MTVSNTSIRRSGPFDTDGIQTDFAFEFKVFDDSDVIVTSIDEDAVETVLALDIDYTVALNSNQEDDPGGTVTLLEAPDGPTITLTSDMPATQPTTFAGRFYPAVLNNALDRAIILIQQVLEKLDRALLAPYDTTPIVGMYPVVGPNRTYIFSTGTGSDPALRSDLAAGTDDLVGTPYGGLHEVLGRRVASLPEYRLLGALTDDAALAAAIADGRRTIYLPAGQGLGDNGEYLIGIEDASTNNLTSGLRLIGDGPGQTVVQTPDDTFAFVFHYMAATTAAGDRIRDLVIEGMTLDGQVETYGFIEQHSLLALRGSDGVTIKNVEFLGPRGDGITMHARNPLSGPYSARHNYNLDISNCVFDGVNNDNRNGISILDLDGFYFRNLTMRNLSKSTMPGPIDFEPDSTDTTAVLRSGVIDGVDFDSNGGNFGEIGFLIPAEVVTPPQDVTVRNVRSRGYVGAATGTLISYAGNRACTTASLFQNIVFENIRGTGAAGYRPFQIDGARGVTIKGRWDTYGKPPFIGFETTEGCADLVVDVDLQAVGTASGEDGLWIGEVDGLVLNAVIRDCGENAAGHYPIRLIDGRTSARLVLNDVQIFKRSNQTIGIKQGTHTQTPAGNRVRKLRLDGLSSDFDYAPGEEVTGIIEAGTWNFTGTVYRLENGDIQIAGDAVAGDTTDGQTIMVLPAGARPGVHSTFAVGADAFTRGQVIVLTDGQLVLFGMAGATDVHLASIRFTPV